MIDVEAEPDVCESTQTIEFPDDLDVTVARGHSLVVIAVLDSERPDALQPSGVRMIAARDRSERPIAEFRLGRLDPQVAVVGVAKSRVDETGDGAASRSASFEGDLVVRNEAAVRTVDERAEDGTVKHVADVDALKDLAVAIVTVAHLRPVEEQMRRLTGLAVVGRQSAVTARVAHLEQVSGAVEVLDVEAVALRWSVEDSLDSKGGQAVQVVLRLARHYDRLEVAVFVVVKLILFAAGKDNICRLELQEDLL